MLRVLLVRLVIGIPTLLLASLLVFSITYVIPGDPAVQIAGEYADADRISMIRSQLGLDDPFFKRYFEWLGSALHGDFGVSLFTNEPVSQAISRAFPVTVQLVLMSLTLSLVVGIVLGMLGSLPSRGYIRGAAAGLMSVAIAIPNFWLGMMLVSIFSLGMGLFPATGFTPVWDDLGAGLSNTLLPAIALGLAGAAEVAKQLSASIGSTSREDFVRTASSKGMGRAEVVVRDVLPGASIAPLTTFGVLASRTIGATVAVEAVFGIPGLGSLVVKAATDRDLPVLQGVVLVLATVVVLISIAVDLAYRLIDPRMRS